MPASSTLNADARPLPSLGFVLLSFNQPAQTIALCQRLTALFGAPGIALHHDFGQCDLDRTQLPANVRVVEPWFRTGWGVYPVVEANFAALRLLNDTFDPDWVTFLSTTDYPVKTPHHILRELRDTPYDAFLDTRELHPLRLPTDHVRDQAKAFSDPAWEEVAYNRYVAVDINPDRLTWRFPALHKPRLLRGRLAERALTPFGPRFRPFGGDAWYTLNRKAAHVLPEKNEQLQRLQKHYLHRRSPEESIYQTILCNRPALRVHASNLRFTDWSRGGPSPRVLGFEDIATLVASSAHFARKFPFEPALFDALDRAAAESDTAH